MHMPTRVGNGVDNHAYLPNKCAAETYFTHASQHPGSNSSAEQRRGCRRDRATRHGRPCSKDRIAKAGL